MLRRLFLSLLAICLALPALAMPTGHAMAQMPSAKAQADHNCHQPAKQAPQQDHGQKHECIGCIARYDGMVPSLAAPIPVEAQPTVPFSVQMPQTRAGPDTPPPKA
ncbi:MULTISPECIES: hypothetical protein [unclassified Novosphingobium]|uniref:hypothetical protein n=1 Tax=unclassified Novosphingobium TaxID=2644732 RepID=UPI0025D41819|nr:MULTISPECIES: hypothetical protein [unclassified Novosphingobium]HQV02802.1 hypothetical protein [Novosphingobium sp.]